MGIINFKGFLRRTLTAGMAIGIITTGSALAASAGVISEAPAYIESDVLSAEINDEISGGLAAVTLKDETKYNNDNTHPWGSQTDSINVRWSAVEGAERYQIWVKGGQYKSWTKAKTVFADNLAYTVKNLKRDTEYSFKVRAVATGEYGPFSQVQKISTARIDFDEAGWQAICRIVYHEVGKVNDKMWNEPIVHVADCVINRYEAAKYLDDPTWAPHYRRFSTVQGMIYSSGEFMSDWGLAADGASYANVSSKVKNAAYGAIYDKATVDDIEHDRDVTFWCNRWYCPSGSKVAYTYKIPWGGYFVIWNEYWG